jgi:amino acid permease
VLRRYQQMSSDQQAQHRRFRSQLNIYCLLTLIFLGLAVLSPVLLAAEAGSTVGAAAFAAVYLLSSLVSYRAAISSAVLRCQGTTAVLLCRVGAGAPAPAPAAASAALAGSLRRRGGAACWRR